MLFLLNYVVLIPSIGPTAGAPEDWIAFWPIYISSIASFFMIFLTSKSLHLGQRSLEQAKRALAESRRQFQENQKQWAEERRPRLNVSVIVSQEAYYMKIHNSGKYDAYNIRVNVNDNFISNLIKEKYKDVFISLQNAPFYIEAGKSKYFFIGFCQDVIGKWKDKNVILRIKGTYCDSYEMDVSLNMDDFIDKLYFVVNDELTTLIGHVKKGLVVQNDQYYPIQKSLDVIAKQLIQMNKKIKENESE